jgi:gamma-glutamyltranspeptidase/glutathione hydrolase
MAEHHCDWVDPVSIGFHDLDVHEIPPNGQGLAALMALGMLNNTPLGHLQPDSADAVHLQIEAMKLAFADAHRYIADPDHMDVRTAALLDPAYHARRARLIDAKRAGTPEHGTPTDRGTVLLCAADAEGTMVSLIQSNFGGFGSGVVVPGTGIALQNRANGFSLQPGHPNEVGGGKRPYHTIIPAFATCGVEAAMAFGVMGGAFQPQGHVQMAVRMMLFGFNPQAASDAPRWRVNKGLEVSLEEGFDPDVAEALERRGHRIRYEDAAGFGGAQIIVRLEDGVYCAGSDHRKDGGAVGY